MNKIMNLLITSEPNIRYLSNFTGSKAIILQTPKHNYFITDARYFDEAKKIIPQDFILEKYKKTDFEDFWAKTLKKHHIKELFFEADHLTYSALKKWKEISRPTKLLPQSGGIEKLRAIKKAEEIALITHSQRINEQIFYSIIKLLKPGIKESEIAWRIHEIGRDLSFEPIIAFGKNSGIPHHQSDNTRLKKGDVVLIDMGVKYKGYCSDMTRTLFTKTPTQFEAKIYETVLETQNKAGSQNMVRRHTNIQEERLSRKFHPRSRSRSRPPNPRIPQSCRKIERQIKRRHDNHSGTGYLYRRKIRRKNRRYGNCNKRWI